MKILSTLLLLLLTACGPKGDKIPHTPPPPPPPVYMEAGLTKAIPLEGNHVPMMTYFKYDYQNKFLFINFWNESCSVISEGTFKSSTVGQNLIPGTFQNGGFPNQLYLYFVLQIPNSSSTSTPQYPEELEYTLSLFPKGSTEWDGFETVIINGVQTVMNLRYSDPGVW